MKGASRWLDAQAPPPVGAAAASKARAKAVSFLSLDRISVSFVSPHSVSSKLERSEDLGHPARFGLRFGARGPGQRQQRLLVDRESASRHGLVEGLARVFEPAADLVLGGELADG